MSKSDVAGWRSARFSVISKRRDIQRKVEQSGVPVIKIGSRWIVGFDRPAIERELARRS